MKRKVLGVLLSVAMVATMVAGCGSSSEPAATDDAAATEEAAPADGPVLSEAFPAALFPEFPAFSADGTDA